MLKSERVDDLDEARLFGQDADAVLVVAPPWHAEVVGPVARRIRRRHVHEPAVLGEVDEAARNRIDAPLDVGRLLVEPVRYVLAGRVQYGPQKCVTFN